MVYFISQINSRVVFRSVVSATCPFSSPFANQPTKLCAHISTTARSGEADNPSAHSGHLPVVVVHPRWWHFAGKQKLHADNLSGDFIYRAIRLLRTLTCASVGCKWFFKDSWTRKVTRDRKWSHWCWLLAVSAPGESLSDMIGWRNLPLHRIPKVNAGPPRYLQCEVLLWVCHGMAEFCQLAACFVCSIDVVESSINNSN